MIRVYVAGPYTQGDVQNNIRVAVEAAQRLRIKSSAYNETGELRATVAPFIPHVMYDGWAKQASIDYEDVMQQCFAWVRVCNALLRIPGSSAGADREAALAHDIGIPVFGDVESVITWAAEQKQLEEFWSK